MIRKRINKINPYNDELPLYSSVYGKKQKTYQNTNYQSIKKHYYTQGDLGFNKPKTEYIAHLIKRFNEYKKKEVGKENVNYQAFENTLKKNYFITDQNKSIYHISILKFDELAKYIQKRIDTTKFAVTLGRDHKNYSSFEDYTARQS